MQRGVFCGGVLHIAARLLEPEGASLQEEVGVFAYPASSNDQDSFNAYGIKSF